MRRTYISVVLAAAAAALLAVPAASAAPPFTPEVAVLGVTGEVGPASARMFVAKLQGAAARTPRFIVIEIDATSADAGAARDMANAVARIPREVETVSFVTGRAGGTIPLLALSTDHLAMAPGARLGDCSGAATEAFARELAARAAEHDYPEALAAAMADARHRVYRLTIEDESGAAVEAFVSEERIAEWPKARLAQVRARDPVTEAGRLLSLDPGTARKTGFARWLPRDRAELVSELENRARGPLAVRELDFGVGIERFLLWAARNGVLPIFLFAGFLGLLIELYHPGTIVPGALGILCIAVALSGGHLAGLTTMLEVGLIAGGVVCLVLEIFVIPGFGILGVTGILALLAGGFLAFQQAPWPTSEAQWAEWRTGARTFMLGIGGTIAAFAVAARLLPRSPLLNKLVHGAAQPVEDGYTVASPSRVALLGRTGLAATDLRPAGKIVIADEVLDAVSDGKWIEKGAAVEVIDTSENRLVVKKA